MLNQYPPAFEELLKFYEAVTFRFPLAMMETLSAVAEYSITELEQWRRLMGLLPVPQLFAATRLVPAPAGGAELTAFAAQLETMREDLRSAAAGTDASIAAVVAEVERVSDEFRGEIKAVRAQVHAVAADKNALISATVAEIRAALHAIHDELGAVSADHSASTSALAANTSGLEALRIEVRTVRDEFHSALDEKVASIGDHAAALKSIREELRALRDQMQKAQFHNPASSAAAAGGAFAENPIGESQIPARPASKSRTSDSEGRKPKR